MPNGYWGKRGYYKYERLCPFLAAGRSGKYSWCLKERCKFWYMSRNTCVIWEICNLLGRIHELMQPDQYVGSEGTDGD